MNLTDLSKLQWGHDKIVMEVDVALRVMLAGGMLQWGHDKIVMEVADNDVSKITVIELQWGHDKIVMEVSYRSSRSLCCLYASMGP